MTSVKTVLLHQCSMDKGTGVNVVNTGQRGNGVYACSYCSTVTSVCYGYRD